MVEIALHLTLILAKLTRPAGYAGRINSNPSDKPMTVKELKAILNDLPDSMQVFVAERKSEFKYGLVNSVYVKEIDFMENPDDDEVLAREKVVCIDEE